MRRLLIVVLAVLTLTPRSLPADTPYPPAYPPSITAQAAYPWIARWFVGAVADWAVGKLLDYGVDRIRLSRAGHQAADHVADLQGRGRLSSADLATLREAETTIRAVAGTLARGELSDAEARRRIVALERDMVGRLSQLNRRLGETERRIYAMEVRQQAQLRMLVELNGQVVALGNRLYDLEGRYDVLAARTDSLAVALGGTQSDVIDLQGRTEGLEEVVYPDPYRYLRFGTYFSLYGLYADATEMAGDANIGLGLSVQANLSRWLGVYGEAAIIPIQATDAMAPDSAEIEWVTFPVMLGFALNILPPQSPISLQVSGGGGIAYSSLRYYPEDYDPELGNWEDVADVASLIGSGKVEIGAAPVLSDFEPVLTIGYMGFLNPINYSDGSTASSNAGRQLLYVSLGGRLRTNLPGERGRSRR
jgi:uncharacterized coiled-coil protein SlyX